MIQDVPPATFDATKSYLITGALLNKLCTAIQSRTPIAGVGITLKEVSKGIEIAAARGASGQGMDVNIYFATDPANHFRLYIRGGLIVGSNVDPAYGPLDLDGTFFLDVAGPGGHQPP